MKAFALFWLGIWVVGTAWLITGLVFDRLSLVHRVPPVPCPQHRMETVSEAALRAMLIEAMKARGVDLQARP